MHNVAHVAVVSCVNAHLIFKQLHFSIINGIKTFSTNAFVYLYSSLVPNPTCVVLLGKYLRLEITGAYHYHYWLRKVGILAN